VDSRDGVSSSGFSCWQGDEFGVEGGVFDSNQEGFGGHEGEVDGPCGDRCGTWGRAVHVWLGTRRRVPLASGAGSEVGGEEVWHGVG
jgi:hypothetical protein